MYKLLLPVILIAIAIAGCVKNDSVCPQAVLMAPDSQVVALQRYIDTSGITAVKDPRGFFYSILDSGTSLRPTPCNAVTVNYSGTLVTNAIFDANHNSRFSLKQVISGWQEAIPLIGQGGRMKLYLPPFLAYGTGSTTVIPANSILIFSIELVGIQ